MNIFLFFIMTLATWRVTKMITSEEGPFEIFEKFRIFAGVKYNVSSVPYGTTWFSRGVLCFWCVSFWVSLVFSLIWYSTFDGLAILNVLWVWPAISALSIFADKVYEL